MAFQVINFIILLVLALATLRNVIAHFLSIPADKPWSWVFYPQYDKQLLRQLLRELGIDEEVVRTQIRRSRSTVNVAVRAETSLVELLSKYIVTTENELYYGHGGLFKSRFYVNTMDAALNSDDLRTMADLIADLVYRREDRPIPDYVLTPKAGNPLLGRKFAEMHRLISVLGKDPAENSYARIDPADAQLSLLVNFEGARWLLRNAAQTPSKALRGILVDCNATSGTQVLGAIRAFNDNLKAFQRETASCTNIDPIGEAYILFSPNHGDALDRAFRQHGIVCHRYFDLEEDLKRELYEYRDSTGFTHLDYMRDDHREFIDQFIKKLWDRDLFRTTARPQDSQ